jgi:SAM-dependent methyltransferase
VPRCIHCGGRLDRRRDYIYQSATFKSIYSDGGFYRCSLCSLFQVNVEGIDEAELTDYYRYAYRREARITSNATQANSAYYRARAAGLLALICQHRQRPPKRIFELGAGYGYNLLAAGQAFDDVELVSDEIDELLRNLPGILQGQLSDGTYDVIIMSHVLEHFLDPCQVLQTAMDALAPDGIIVLEVPNDSSGHSTITACDEPHITFFSPRTLRSLVETIEDCHVADLYTAGPSPQRVVKSRRIAAILGVMPVLGRLTYGAKRLLRNTTSGGIPDLTSRTENGIFLRAVLQRAP